MMRALFISGGQGVVIFYTVVATKEVLKKILHIFTHKFEYCNLITH